LYADIAYREIIAYEKHRDQRITLCGNAIVNKRFTAKFKAEESSKRLSSEKVQYLLGYSTISPKPHLNKATPDEHSSFVLHACVLHQ
jgi:NAD dependent epimerase/dehydratase family enzyme